jgi:hypothetical protein
MHTNLKYDERNKNDHFNLWLKTLHMWSNLKWINKSLNVQPKYISMTKYIKLLTQNTIHMIENTLFANENIKNVIKHFKTLDQKYFTSTKKRYNLWPKMYYLWLITSYTSYLINSQRGDFFFLLCSKFYCINLDVWVDHKYKYNATNNILRKTKSVTCVIENKIQKVQLIYFRCYTLWIMTRFVLWRIFASWKKKWWI